jgi:hypothetical protein
MSRVVDGFVWPAKRCTACEWACPATFVAGRRCLTIRQRLSHELDARKDQIPAILDALYEKAQRGDVPAARELRGWYDQGLGKPEAASLDTAGVDERSYADKTPEERARLRAALIKRIAEAEATLEDGAQAGA